MTAFRLLLVIVLCPLLSTAAMEKVTSDIFKKGSTTKLFTYEGSRDFTNEDMVYKAAYKNLDGSVAVSESATIKAGMIESYEVESMQTGDKGKITTKKGKIYFEYKPKGKKAEKSYTKLMPNTVVSANLIPLAVKNFDKLLAKKTVTFSFAVWYRKEMITFRFTYEKDDAKTLTIKMSPSHLLYRSLVDPIYYVIDKKTKRLISSSGRVVPKLKKGRAWKDLDADVKYKYL